MVDEGAFKKGFAGGMGCGCGGCTLAILLVAAGAGAVWLWLAHIIQQANTTP